MSELKTNKISTNDQNNVALDNALGLKSYTTAGRDALTSVAGDMIYNTTLGNPQVYTGSTWNDLKAGVEGVSIEYLVIAGGGGSAGGTSEASPGGGGGAGGYRTNRTGQTSGGGASAEETFIVPKSSNLTVTVGAGGAGGTAPNGSASDARNGQTGNNSVFSRVISLGGGGGYEFYSVLAYDRNPTGPSLSNDAGLVGSGAGAAWGGTAYGRTVGDGIGLGRTGQGTNGGQSTFGSGNDRASGGGGGAGTSGGASSSNNGGDGGNGLSSDITGSAVTRAGGGAGGSVNGGTGGTGGGGDGEGSTSTLGGTGAVNTGSGAGASRGSSGSAIGGSAGGSGVVILRWATADATIGATRTGLTDGGVQTDGTDSYIVFTAGTGTISFS